MAKRRDRALEELYKLTGKLSKPKITLVLKGSYHMQGPVDDSDHDIETNKEAAPIDKILVEEPNRHSFDILKSRACDDQQHTASEASNLVSPSSSHNSFSENAESRVTIRTSDTSDSSLLDSGIKLPIHEERVLECHGDNISFITGVKNLNVPSSNLIVGLDGMNASCSSASTRSLCTEGFEKILQVQTRPDSLIDGSCDMQGDRHSSEKLITSVDPFWKKGYCISSTATAGFSHDSDPSEFPSSNDIDGGTTSPKTQVPSSHSRSTNSVIYNVDSKDSEENSSSRHREEPSECSTEHVETSLPGPVTTKGNNGQKSSVPDSPDILPYSEDGKSGQFKSSSSFVVVMKAHPCTETENGMDLPSANTDKQESPVPSRPILESEHSGSDIMEDDVKVCDICGDTGREDMLAVCSRCNDGAEHTYCMQKMLDKVPEGDWLCEECKHKEDSETQKSHAFETAVMTPKLPSSNEKIPNSRGTFNFKALSKLDVKVLGMERNRALKASSNLLVSLKRNTENIEVASTTKKQALETPIGLHGIASPSKKPALSRETSFKNSDVGKVKSNYPPTLSGSQSANNSREGGKLHAILGPNSSSMQPKLQLPPPSKLTSPSSLSCSPECGNASPGGLSNFSSKAPILSKVPELGASPIPRPKSSVLQNLNSKPKVKQVLEDVSQKQKLVRGSTISDIKKEAVIRAPSKSNSVMSMGSRSTLGESKLKTQNPNLSRVEDSRGLKQVKERPNIIERKNSFKLDHPLTSSSSTIAARVSLPKIDQKVISHCQTLHSPFPSVSNQFDLKATEPDGKLKPSTDPTILAPVKGSESTIPSGERSDMKKQSSYCVDFGAGTGGSQFQAFPSLDGMPSTLASLPDSSLEEKKPCQFGHKEETTLGVLTADKQCRNPGTLLQDGLSPSWESTNRDGRPWQSFTPGGRVVRCYKCNGMGHIAHYCNSSPCVSALMASAARSSREITGKSKWKHAVEAAMSKKTRTSELKRLPERSDELSVSNADPCCEEVSKDTLANYVGVPVDINVTANSPSSCMRSLLSVERTFDGQGSLRLSLPDYSKTSTGVGMKHRAFASPIRTAAIPEHDYLWQGCFEVKGSGRLPDLFDGIQAHLSICASPRVSEAASKFPLKVELEEVPRLTSWPVQFHGGSPTEDNIALYFFAKDLESYERSYKKLLEGMLKTDSALRGDFNGIELLIFPSNQLPEKSQRWNRLFFLWGVFRGRKESCSDQLGDSLKKLSVDSLNAQSSIRDLYPPVIAEFSMSQKISSYRQMDRELSKCDKPSGARETVKLSASMDLPSPSPRRDCSDCRTQTRSLNKKSSVLSKLNHPAVDRTLSSEKHSSCSITDIQPPTDVAPVDNLNDIDSSSRVLMSNTPMCSEVKSSRISLKEVYRDAEIRKDTELQICAQATIAQRSPVKGKSVSMFADGLNCRVAFPSADTSSDSSKILPINPSCSGQEAGSNETKERFRDRYAEQKPEILKEKERFRDGTNLISIKEKRDWPAREEHDSWESRSNRKCPHLHSSETVSEASGDTSKDTSQTMTWKDKSDCLSTDRDNDCKRPKRSHSELQVRTSSREQNFSDGFISDVQNHKFLKEEGKGASVYDETLVPENSRTTERFFFPVDLGSVRDCKSSNSEHWSMSMTNDESPPDSDFPNLELALGAEKKPSNKGILPLFVQFVDKEGTEEKPPDMSTNDDGNNDLSSLSLSLAFPFSEKDGKAKPVPRTEQLLPERHHVDTSLLLFGGYTDA